MELCFKNVRNVQDAEADETVSVKHRVRPTSVHIAEKECALIVEYVQEDFAILPDGSYGELQGTSMKTKKVKVRHELLHKVDDLLHEVVNKSKFMKSIAEDIRAKLIELQQRELPKLSQQQEGSLTAQNTTGDSTAAGKLSKSHKHDRHRHREGGKKHHRSRVEKISSENKAGKKGWMEAERQEQVERQRKFEHQIFASQIRASEAADIAQLDDYIESLYEEDHATKVNGLALISNLFRQTSHFPTLIRKDGLLKLLARTLGEEGRKSTDVAINTIAVFFSLSNFRDLHYIFDDYSIVPMVVQLVDLEVKRTDLRTKEQGMAPSEIASLVMEAQNGEKKISKEQTYMINQIKKQDRLLYLCFYLLLNLAEDMNMERLLCKNNLVKYLCRMLERSNVELLILSVMFLKKLSIYQENKEKMLKYGIMKKLFKFMPVHSPVLMMALLRLLHNLSFDSKVRADMVAIGFIPKLCEIMQSRRFQAVCLGILYHISMEDAHKSLFVYTHPPMMATIFDRLVQVNSEELRADAELIALAVNLTQNARCAAEVAHGSRFDRLMAHALDLQDDLLFKVMRNVSQVDDKDLKQRFGPYVDQLILILKSNPKPELFVEVLGCLANLSLPKFNFGDLVQRHDLLNFLAEFAKPGMVEDDILLEVVMFVGVLCNENTADQIDKSGLLQMLFQHMGDKKEDDEFVLQITYTFSKLLSHAVTAQRLLDETDIVYYLVDLLQDKNKEVRKHADKALETLLAHDPGKETMIRELKFKTFNQEWLDFVDQNVDSVNLPPHSPMSPPPHEALMGLYDDEETAQILGLLDGNGGRPPLAPKGSVSAMGSPIPGLEEVGADGSDNESSAALIDERKMPRTAEDEVLDEDLSQEYVM